MEHHLLKKGTLKTQIHNRNSAIDAIFLASSIPEEEWANVEVVTLKQHCRDQAIDQLQDLIDFNGEYDDCGEISELANKIYRVAQEFVRFDTDRITIGVDVDIVDDKAIDYALSMLMDHMNHMDTTILNTPSHQEGKL